MIPNVRRRGFSLLELLIVIAILMVVAAIATPSIITTVDSYRLRTAASDMAGLMQRTRMQAVSLDHWYHVANGTTAGRSFAYADLDGDNALDQPAEFMIMLPSGITVETTGAPALTTMGLDFTANAGMAAFNARGLPCQVSGGACVSPAAAGGGEGWSGYVCYLRQDRSMDQPGWAAITVSAAGRVRFWTWTGSKWN